MIVTTFLTKKQLSVFACDIIRYQSKDNFMSYEKQWDKLINFEYE
jgi:hypothetical protein